MKHAVIVTGGKQYRVAVEDVIYVEKLPVEAGETVTIDDVEYNFGDGIADVETRLDILANIETTVLGTYDYLPMLQDASAALLSQQVYYVVEEYNPIMGRGGITYMKYNYDETEWADFVASQADGTLSY